VKVEIRCWDALEGGGTLGAAIKCVFGADSAAKVVVEGVVTVSITLINIHALGPYVCAYVWTKYYINIQCFYKCMLNCRIIYEKSTSTVIKDTRVSITPCT